jgi:hypothetical protein
MARSIHDEDFEGAGDLDAVEGLGQSTKVAIVAVLLALAGIGGALLYFSVGEGDVTNVFLTAPSDNGDVLTFAYTISTTRALADGTGTFTVALDGTQELSRPVAVRGGGGRIDVKFSDFVVGNGDYQFRLEYKGRQGASNFTIGTLDHTDFIVTAIRVDATSQWGSDNRTGMINFNLNFFSDLENGFYARAPPGSTFNLTVLKNGVRDGPTITRGADGLVKVHLLVEVSLGPGNYTVDVTFNNQWVKDTAPIKTLTGNNMTFVHNKPRACVNPTTYHGNNANGYNITADGSCSTDDLAIVQYNWDFGDGTPVVSSGTIPLEAHTFPASTVTRTYTCTLTVSDAFVDGDDSTTFTVTTSQN